MTNGSKGKVLIDGDLIAYRAAFATQDYEPDDAVTKVDELMSFIVEKTVDIPFASSGDYNTYLTGKGNFRYDIAKAAPYKGNRAEIAKPIHLGLCRDYMVENYQAIVSYGEEADDLISKAAAALDYNCVVASIDKDMLQLPCWHFNFGKNEWTKVEPIEGLRFFYSQILTGDRADNIIGLYGIGPKKAEKLLQDCNTEEDMWYAVINAYMNLSPEHRGNKDYPIWKYAEDRVTENGRLLWLRRYEDEIWEAPK